ncbi:hypothetical protein GE09DRAFT_1079083 [Coniochaeta sp. 2T2.1]|nr:hypothetical protein GE09DRAFT_1079083 [Coniochaeta sp. 2T2.1]
MGPGGEGYNYATFYLAAKFQDPQFTSFLQSEFYEFLCRGHRYIAIGRVKDSSDYLDLDAGKSGESNPSSDTPSGDTYSRLEQFSLDELASEVSESRTANTTTKKSPGEEDYRSEGSNADMETTASQPDHTEPADQGNRSVSPVDAIHHGTDHARRITAQGDPHLAPLVREPKTCTEFSPELDCCQDYTLKDSHAATDSTSVEPLCDNEMHNRHSPSGSENNSWRTEKAEPSSRGCTCRDSTPNEIAVAATDYVGRKGLTDRTVDSSACNDQGHIHVVVVPRLSTVGDEDTGDEDTGDDGADDDGADDDGTADDGTGDDGTGDDESGNDESGDDDNSMEYQAEDVFNFFHQSLQAEEILEQLSRCDNPFRNVRAWQVPFCERRGLTLSDALWELVKAIIAGDEDPVAFIVGHGWDLELNI